MTGIPRVAVCIPSSDFVHADMMMSLFGMGVECASVISSAHNRKRDVITASRNWLVREALALDRTTHLLWSDDDHVFPMNGLYHLLRHDKDIVGCFHSGRCAPYPIIGHFGPDQPEFDMKKDGGLRRAAIIGGGFVLVKRDVYEKLSPPWYREDYTESNKDPIRNPDGHVSEDAYFCRTVHDAGFEMWCDLDLSYHMLHIGTQHVPFGGPNGEGFDV